MIDAIRAAREEARRRAHALFDPIAAEYLTRDGVDIGRMFGSEGLRIRGKIFAFVGFDGALMLKLPADRTDALVAEAAADRLVMRGSEMREWVTVDQGRGASWRALIDEAYAFVDEITP